MNEVSIHKTSTPRFLDRLHDAFREGDEAPEAKLTEGENVRRLQGLYRAVSRGDFAPLEAAMDEGVELDLRGPVEVPVHGCWRGRAEVVAAVKRNFGSLADQQAEILSVVAQGDTVVLLAEERGQVRCSGAAYHLRWVQLFTFKGDKIVRVRGVSAHLPAPDA
jgi:ketosteroid isomerase-like protein